LCIAECPRRELITQGDLTHIDFRRDEVRAKPAMTTAAKAPGAKHYAGNELGDCKMVEIICNNFAKARRAQFVAACRLIVIGDARFIH
jgi:hypothetical protein